MGSIVVSRMLALRQLDAWGSCGMWEGVVDDGLVLPCELFLGVFIGVVIGAQSYVVARMSLSSGVLVVGYASLDWDNCCH